MFFVSTPEMTSGDLISNMSSNLWTLIAHTSSFIPLWSEIHLVGICESNH